MRGQGVAWSLAGDSGHRATPSFKVAFPRHAGLCRGRPVELPSYSWELVMKNEKNLNKSTMQNQQSNSKVPKKNVNQQGQHVVRPPHPNCNKTKEELKEIASILPIKKYRSKFVHYVYTLGMDEDETMMQFLAEPEVKDAFDDVRLTGEAPRIPGKYLAKGNQPKGPKPQTGPNPGKGAGHWQAQPGTSGPPTEDFTQQCQRLISNMSNFGAGLTSILPGPGVPDGWEERRGNHSEPGMEGEVLNSLGNLPGVDGPLKEQYERLLSNVSKIGGFGNIVPFQDGPSVEPGPSGQNRRDSDGHLEPKRAKFSGPGRRPPLLETPGQGPGRRPPLLETPGQGQGRRPPLLETPGQGQGRRPGLLPDPVDRNGPPARKHLLETPARNNGPPRHDSQGPPGSSKPKGPKPPKKRKAVPPDSQNQPRPGNNTGNMPPGGMMAPFAGPQANVPPYNGPQGSMPPYHNGMQGNMPFNGPQGMQPFNVGPQGMQPFNVGPQGMQPFNVGPQGMQPFNGPQNNMAPFNVGPHGNMDPFNYGPQASAPFNNMPQGPPGNVPPFNVAPQGVPYHPSMAQMNVGPQGGMQTYVPQGNAPPFNAPHGNTPPVGNDSRGTLPFSSAMGDGGRVLSTPSITDPKVPLYIVPTRYPSERFSDEQMDAIENAILEAILEVDDERLKPTFQDSFRNRGRYGVICNDQLSLNWLFSYLGRCRPWPNASFKVILAAPPKVRAEALLPVCRNDDNDKVLKFIGKQNTKIDVSQWEVVQRLDGVSNTTLSLMIDEDSARVLRECGRINFKMGQAEIIVEGASEVEQGRSERMQPGSVSPPGPFGGSKVRYESGAFGGSQMEQSGRFDRRSSLLPTPPPAPSLGNALTRRSDEYDEYQSSRSDRFFRTPSPEPRAGQAASDARRAPPRQVDRHNQVPTTGGHIERDYRSERSRQPSPARNRFSDGASRSSRIPNDGSSRNRARSRWDDSPSGRRSPERSRPIHSSRR